MNDNLTRHDIYQHRDALRLSPDRLTILSHTGELSLMYGLGRCIYRTNRGRRGPLTLMHLIVSLLALYGCAFRDQRWPVMWFTVIYWLGIVAWAVFGGYFDLVASISHWVFGLVLLLSYYAWRQINEWRTALWVYLDIEYLRRAKRDTVTDGGGDGA